MPGTRMRKGNSPLEGMAPPQGTAQPCLILCEAPYCLEGDEIIAFIEHQIDNMPISNVGQIEAHLTECASCRKAYEEFARTYLLSVQVALLEAVDRELNGEQQDWSLTRLKKMTPKAKSKTVSQSGK